MGMEWLAALDFDQALHNVAVDMRGDWHRDPWGWPEAKWVVKNDLALLTRRLNARGTWKATPIDVAKENFGIRPAVVLDPIDRLLYQALVDRLSADLIGKQPRWAYGWRLPPDDPTSGMYARNDYQWANFRNQLSNLAGFFDAGLKSDVVSFFASVDLDVVADQIYDRAGSNRVVQRLLSMLEGWQAIPGRSGLPQRSAASAVLAHLYLKPLHDLLLYYGAVSNWWKFLAPEGAAARWMDDIWLFSGDAGRLRRAQVTMQTTLRELGLNMNLAKTDVLEGDELVREARELEHSAVDSALALGGPDHGPLGELIDRILDQPERASRTSVKFATTRMRWHDVYEQVNDFVEKAPRLPHAADAIARLFRDSGAWRDLDGWYVTFCQSEWATIEWAVAQLATMFPGSEPSDRIVDHFAQSVASGRSSLTTLTVGAERLARWRPDLARVAIREAATTTAHPLYRRVLALAALHSGEERSYVRSLLREYEENSVTLAMLESARFRPPRVAKDFDHT